MINLIIPEVVTIVYASVFIENFGQDQGRNAVLCDLTGIEDEVAEWNSGLENIY